MDRVGINVNDAWNGFWTKDSRHLGSHTDKYLLEMGETLKDLNDKKRVIDALEELRAGLFNGDYL